MNNSSRPLPLRERVFRYRGYSFLCSFEEVKWVVVLCFLLLCLSVYLLSIGRFEIGLAHMVDILLGNRPGSIEERIIWNIRLPRLVTALFVGAALGISGAVFQSVSKNALGSPDIIGFTTGAATGALIQIILFEQHSLLVALSAVAGGILTSVTVYLLSRKGGIAGGYRLILVGIGVGAILSALNGLMLVKGHIDQAITANLWLAGSLHGRTWEHALPVVLGIVLVTPFMLTQIKALQMIEMGDDMALQLGIRVERVRFGMLLSAVILAALATGAAGPIAFIALAAPQLVKRVVKSGRIPVIGSALMGSLLLVLADLIAQLNPLGFTLPIGQLTGLVGGIYLIWLLRRTDNL